MEGISCSFPPQEVTRDGLDRFSARDMPRAAEIERPGVVVLREVSPGHLLNRDRTAGWSAIDKDLAACAFRDPVFVAAHNHLRRHLVDCGVGVILLHLATKIIGELLKLCECSLVRNDSGRPMVQKRPQFRAEIRAREVDRSCGRDVVENGVGVRVHVGDGVRTRETVGVAEIGGIDVVDIAVVDAVFEEPGGSGMLRNRPR